MAAEPSDVQDYRKARGIHGELVLPFEARLETRDGKAAWSMKDVEDADRLRVSGLLAAGMTVREIAEEIGIGKIGGAPHEAAHRPRGEGARGGAGRGRIGLAAALSPG